MSDKLVGEWNMLGSNRIVSQGLEVGIIYTGERHYGVETRQVNDVIFLRILFDYAREDSEIVGHYYRKTSDFHPQCVTEVRNDGRKFALLVEIEGYKCLSLMYAGDDSIVMTFLKEEAHSRWNDEFGVPGTVKESMSESDRELIFSGWWWLYVMD